MGLFKKKNKTYVSVRHYEKKKRIRKYIILGVVASIIVVGAIAATVFFFTMRSRSKDKERTINARDFLNISCYGYSGYGKAEVNYDIAKFEEKYGNIIEDSASFCEKCLKGHFMTQSKLKNEDVLSYVWDSDKETLETTYNVIINRNDIEEFIVNGLMEEKAFDAFAGVNVNFFGYQGQGSAVLTGDFEWAKEGLLSYTLSKKEALSNGEKVVLSVNYDMDSKDELIARYGGIPSSDKNEYTVSGLLEKKNKGQDLSFADMTYSQLDSMNKDAYKICNNYFKNTLFKSLTLKGIVFLGWVFEADINKESTDNKAYSVFQVLFKDKNDKEDQAPVECVFWYVSYSGIERNAKVNLKSAQVVTNEVNIDGVSFAGCYSSADILPSMGSLNASSHRENNLDLNSIIPVTSRTQYTNENTDDTTDSDEDTPTESENGSGTAGCLFPNSSTEIIDVDIIRSLSTEEIQLAINEIWARNGYIFRKKDRLEYFRQFDWYEEKISADEWDRYGQKHYLSDIEMTNIEALTEERERRK